MGKLREREREREEQHYITSKQQEMLNIFISPGINHMVNVFLLAIRV